MGKKNKNFILRIVISCFADTIPLNSNSISYDCFIDIYFKAVFIWFEYKNSINKFLSLFVYFKRFASVRSLENDSK